MMRFVMWIATPQSKTSLERPPRTHLKWLFSIQLIVVSVLYSVSVLYNNARSNPHGVETIQDFYARYGNPPQVETFTINGRTYYRVIGEIAAPLALPNGAPQYIFNASGRLVDWTPAVKNDPDFVARWSDNTAKEMVVSHFLEQFPPN
jgi:hypothetical protein